MIFECKHLHNFLLYVFSLNISVLNMVFFVECRGCANNSLDNGHSSLNLQRLNNNVFCNFGIQQILSFLPVL